MCWACGGPCKMCGETSDYVIVMPFFGFHVYACEEHYAEVEEYADEVPDKIVAAPWN